MATRDCPLFGALSLSLVQPADRHIIAMTGTVTPGTVIALCRTIAAAVDGGHCVIVIDVSAATFLGAQTAGMFCGALRSPRRRGVAVHVVGGPPRLQQMLAAIAGLPSVTLGAEHERDQPRRLEVVGPVAGSGASTNRSAPDAAA